MVGETDRGIQRCSVFPALGNNHSVLSFFVLVTVAALPCIACTLGQLGFALFQVPQLSHPFLLSWVSSTTQPASKVLGRAYPSPFLQQHQGASVSIDFPLEIVLRPRIVWPSKSPSFHPPSFINAHGKFHTHFYLYFFCHRSCTDTELTCTLDLLRQSVLSALLLLRSEISSPFLTAYLFHFSHICSCFNTFMKQRRTLF